jgi:hypothetical protein
MAQRALKEPVVEKGQLPKTPDAESERIARESAERYRRYANDVNRTRDSDIEKALAADRLSTRRSLLRRRLLSHHS